MLKAKTLYHQVSFQKMRRLKVSLHLKQIYYYFIILDAMNGDSSDSHKKSDGTDDKRYKE